MKIFTSKTQKMGETGESEAAAFLKKQGFTIVARNISNKYGEIDIVARKNGVYYFFEVKTGRRGGSITPAENLTKEKLRKCLISVEHYCFLHKIEEYRIQGILVLLPSALADAVQIETIDIF